MNFIKKIFGSKSGDEAQESVESEHNSIRFQDNTPLDEKFTFNFKKNGGKFIYCENLNEVSEQLLNILEENDWFESEAMCLDPMLFHFLDENKLVYKDISNPRFLLTACESLIADEGSVLLNSKQIKQFKTNELPSNIVCFATTSQILDNISDGLRKIKTKYDKDYPNNITTIKYFEKVKEEDFLHYGSTHKNLYLLLLEDL
jgi:L-lactate utilization protein LutC